MIDYNAMRRCTKCKQEKDVRDNFKVTTARGREVVRSWCNDCMKDYYRSVSPRRRKTVTAPPT